MKLRKILIAVDLSDASRKVLEDGLELAERFGSAVEVVYVWPPPTYIPPTAMARMPGWDMASIGEYASAAAEKELRELLTKVPHVGLDLQSRVMTGRAADVVCERAREGRFDLIVIGTHGRTGLARLLLGSVAREVVARAHCPVLTVRTLPEAQQQLLEREEMRT